MIKTLLASTLVISSSAAWPCIPTRFYSCATTAPTASPTEQLFPFVDETKEIYGLAFAAICEEKEIENMNFAYPSVKELFDSSDMLKEFVFYRVITTDYLQCYTGYDAHNNRHVIAFRGSENLDNWMTNLDVPLVSYPHTPPFSWPQYGGIHGGFYDAFQKLEEAGLKNHTLSFVKPGDDILVTGHSLGGALATVASLELKQNPVYKSLSIGRVDVTTFGSPRVMNWALADLYNRVMDSSWRIVNDQDPATIVPPTDWVLGSWNPNSYHHVGTEVWCNRDGLDAMDCRMCDGSGEDENCVLLATPMFHDHLTYFDITPVAWGMESLNVPAYKAKFCVQESAP